MKKIARKLIGKVWKCFGSYDEEYELTPYCQRCRVRTFCKASEQSVCLTLAERCDYKLSPPILSSIDAALALCEKLGLYFWITNRKEKSLYVVKPNCKWTRNEEYNSLSDLAPAILRALLRSMDIKILEV